jgi:hypothetical protein
MTFIPKAQIDQLLANNSRAQCAAVFDRHLRSAGSVSHRHINFREAMASFTDCDGADICFHLHA